MDIVLAGNSFGVEPKAPGGLILKIAEAEANGDVGKALSLTLRMLRLLIVESDRDRFETFVESSAFDSLDFDDIQTALQGAAAGAAARPTERSAPSQFGPLAEPTTSRVVRLSQVTNPESSDVGTSQAS